MARRSIVAVLLAMACSPASPPPSAPASGSESAPVTPAESAPASATASATASAVTASPRASASASVTPVATATPTTTVLPKGAPVPCGGKTCKPTEWCVSGVVIGGAAPPPGTPPPKAGPGSCAAKIPPSGPGHMCLPNEDTRQVQCTGFAPSAAPKK